MINKSEKPILAKNQNGFWVDKKQEKEPRHQCIKPTDEYGSLTRLVVKSVWECKCGKQYMITNITGPKTWRRKFIKRKIKTKDDS